MKKKFWFLCAAALVLAITTGTITAQSLWEKNGNDIERIDSPAVISKQETKEENIISPESVQGIFSGQADNHTVEIQLNDKTRSFAMGEGVTVDSLCEGDKIFFSYLENSNGRLEITRLEKTSDKGNKDQEDKGKTRYAKGILTGRIDWQSVEIEINDEARAFSLSDELRDKDFAAGEISFQYYVDKNGRTIITAADFQKPGKEENQTVSGFFQGLADNHTAEMKINGQLKSLGIDEQVSFQGVQTGEKLHIVYQEINGRPMIVKIERI